MATTPPERGPSQPGEGRSGDVTENDVAAGAGAARDFESFFIENFRPLLVTLLRMGATLNEAEDAVQDAFVTLYKDWDRVAHPYSYARVIATRMFLKDAARARSRRDGEIRSGVDPTVDISSADSMSLVEEAENVRGLLAGLPPQQRVIMALSMDGYGHAEIAEIMGLTTATVRSHYRSARKSLGSRLAQRNHEDDQRAQREPTASE